LGLQEFTQAARLLPDSFTSAVQKLSEETRLQTEEFRLRSGYPLSVSVNGAEQEVPCEPVTQTDLGILLERCTGASVHTAMDSLTKGFVTAEGGHRLGVCGIAGIRDGKPVFRHFTSAVLRIACDIRDCAAPVLKQLPQTSPFPGILIVSPPGLGKTTLLRDLIRELAHKNYRIGIADERGEISGQGEHTRGFPLGRSVDVLSGISRSEALSMLIRTMSPQIAAVDEIGCERDMTSMQGLGYKQILAYLEGEGTLEEAVEKIKLETRHFAKRQLTWFKREPDVIYVDVEKENLLDVYETRHF